MKLYYGVYKLGDEVVLKVSDDLTTIHPMPMGEITAFKAPGTAHIIADLACNHKATAIEINKNLKYLGVR